MTPRHCKLLAVTQGRLSGAAEPRSPAVQPDSALCSWQQSGKPTRQEPGDDYPFKPRRQEDRKTRDPKQSRQESNTQAGRPERKPLCQQEIQPVSRQANTPADRSANVTRSQLVTSKSHKESSTFLHSTRLIGRSFFTSRVTTFLLSRSSNSVTTRLIQSQLPIVLTHLHHFLEYDEPSRTPLRPEVPHPCSRAQCVPCPKSKKAPSISCRLVGAPHFA